MNCNCCYPELQPRGRRKRFQAHLLMDSQSSTPLTSHASPYASVTLSHQSPGELPIELEMPLAEFSGALQPLQSNMSVECSEIKPASQNRHISNDAARSSFSSESTIVVGLQGRKGSAPSPHSMAENFEDGGIFSLQNDVDSWLQMSSIDLAFDYTLLDIDDQIELTSWKDAPRLHGSIPSDNADSEMPPDKHDLTLQNDQEVSQVEKDSLIWAYPSSH